MPISPNFSSIFTKDWEINFTQCLPNGHLKYSELCNILQLTAAAHSEVGGISFTDMQEFDQAWVLSRMRVEIDEMPKWKDIVEVRTWINSLENSRSVRATEFYINEKKIIGIETFWVVFSTKTRLPEQLSLPYKHFEFYPDKLATRESTSKIKYNTKSIIVEEKSILISDIDNVNHVNNVKYLEWCLNLIPEDLILDQLLKSFEMNFIKELSLKDKVTICQSASVDSIIFNINKNDKTCFALQLNLI